MKRYRPSVVVAVDAGLRFTGVAVYDLAQSQFIASHVISTGKQKTQYVAESNKLRVESLSRNLGAIIDRHPTRCVVAELPTGGARSARAATAMAMSFAMVVATCASLGVTLHMVRPLQIKRLIDPTGQAVEKAAVIGYIKRKYGTRFLLNNSKDEHIADAMACCEVFLQELGHNGKSAGNIQNP